MRTAAARLGLGFTAAMASQNISLSVRRFSTSLAAAAAATADVRGKKYMPLGSGCGSGSEAEMELELNKNKSLYLCFSELSGCGGEGYVNQVVRSIRMSSDDDYDGEEQYLQVAAYKRSKITTGWNFSACFGSQILYPFGPDTNYVTRIRSMNTATRPLKFQQKSIAFSRPKINPVLGELNGKLYCVDNVLTGNIKPGPPFEVLDPENDLKWRPLEAPPFIQSCETVKDNYFYASFLEGSNKILGWDRHQPPVFCFDATKPENGWTESSFSLGNTLPFLCDSMRSPVFIHNHHPCLGDFHLMFNYDFLNAPLLVTAYFMSDKSGSFQLIQDTPLKLPDLCYEYIDDLTKPYSETICTKFEFVHLGAQKVCLVLHKFFCYDHYENKNTGVILLITFEYDIIPNTVKDSKSTVEIQTRLIKTHRFRYHPRKIRKSDDTETESVFLTGPYLL